MLRFETDVVFVIGRTQLLGPDDVEALGRIMAAYDIRPISAYTGEPAPEAEPFDWRVWNDDASRDERFIGYVNAILPLCLPFHPEDAPDLERFARIGIGPGEPFDGAVLDGAAREAIRAGVAEARTATETQVAELGRKVKGWALVAVFGDRSWYGGNRLLRAAGAMAGWGGNDLAEAAYPTAREDADGEPLHGDHRYQLVLTSRPPAEAFWSFTMYDTSYDGTTGYMVENPTGRYLINSTTESLVWGADGSLTVYFQQDEPETPEGRANWLPAPAGPCYVVLRIYLPDESVVDGSWEPPPIERVD